MISLNFLNYLKTGCKLGKHPCLCCQMWGKSGVGQGGLPHFRAEESHRRESTAGSIMQQCPALLARGLAWSLWGCRNCLNPSEVALIIFSRQTSRLLPNEAQKRKVCGALSSPLPSFYEVYYFQMIKFTLRSYFGFSLLKFQQIPEPGFPGYSKSYSKSCPEVLFNFCSTHKISYFLQCF